MSDDHSPGDARQRYSDRGGPAARHAETHDVRREELTNPTGPEPVDESFAEDLAPATPDAIRQAQVDGEPVETDKRALESLDDLTSDQVAELTVLVPGTPLEQGAVYLDLNDRARGEFKAMGGTVTEDGDRIVAKRTTDHDAWNTLTGKTH